jgi:transcriptional regulator with XRE-family HTH domain
MLDDNCFGDELKNRRLELGLSVKKLAKLSGVSRRWIGCAEENSNITVDVLKKLMRTMKMTTIRISPELTAAVGANPQDAKVLLSALDELEQSNELSLRAAGKLRDFSVGVGKSGRNDTPQDEGFSERAATLVRQFTAHVRSLSKSPDKLRKVEKAVSTFLTPEAANAPISAKAHPRRRRSTA